MPGNDFSRQGPDVSGGALPAGRLHNNKRSFVTGPPPGFKSNTLSPPSTFLPPPPFPLHTPHTSETYFGLSDESQMPRGSNRSGGALQALLHAASLALPPSFTSQGSGGRKGGRGGEGG